jgi:hypothetical protein
MSTAPQQPDLISQLVAEAHPVRRLWSPTQRLLAWVALAAVLSLGVVAVGARHDLALRLRDPAFLLEVATLAFAGVWMASQALRHAVPGMAPDRFRGIVGLGGVAGMLLLREPIQTALSLDAFVQLGAPCASTAVGLAAGPWAALVIALRRGAPLSAARAGALAGGAAAVLAFMLLRLRCPVEDLLHVLVWHALPVVVAGVACTAVGSWWLCRWRGDCKPRA